MQTPCCGTRRNDLEAKLRAAAQNTSVERDVMPERRGEAAGYVRRTREQ